VSRSLLVFLTPLLGLFAAEFPDDAFPAEFAVDAGVGAGLAKVQALLAVPQFMLLAGDARFPLRVKTACIHTVIIAKGGDPPKFTSGVLGLRAVGRASVPAILKFSGHRCILFWNILLPGDLLYP